MTNGYNDIGNACIHTHICMYVYIYIYIYTHIYIYKPIFPWRTAITNFQVVSINVATFMSYKSETVNRLVMSDSLWPHGLLPPGKTLYELFLKSSNSLSMNLKNLEIVFTENIVPISLCFCIFKRYR